MLSVKMRIDMKIFQDSIILKYVKIFKQIQILFFVKLKIKIQII